jgi:hypothetical protein
MQTHFFSINQKPVKYELVLKVNSDIRKRSKLLTELGLGMPIIAAIKERINRVLEQEKKLGLDSR